MLRDGQKGLGIIELITAMGIFVIFATTAITTLLHTYNVGRLGNEQTLAEIYAQEGIEAVRSIKNRAWTNITAGTYGLSTSGGQWSFSGTSNTSGKFTRQIVVTQGQRNGSNDIVDSGGTTDLNLFKATSTVTWNFSPSRSESVSYATYLTSFRRLWAFPRQISSLNLAGANNGWKVATSGNYAYVIRNSGVTNFYVIDISTPSAPAEVGSLALSGTLSNIAVSGSYVYVTSNDNAAELQIVNVSTPSSPSPTGSFNAAGNADAEGAYVVGTVAYIVRNSSASDEFLIINASTPSSPTLTGSLDLGTKGYEVYVSGSYAYVAQADNAAELGVVDISTPSTPILASTLNLAGNSDAVTIDGVTNAVLLGRVGGDFVTVSVSTPTSPSLSGTLSLGTNINDISVHTNGTKAFLANDDNAHEFQVVNIATLSSPSLFGTYNISGNTNAEGVAYNSSKDMVAVVDGSNTEEFLVFGPQIQ